ncbi:nucleotide exchange factor GrpE [Candidatus Uhrbacteria bacterium]|nr:nucleotide exchange factor GrpE [Candidatus Uhrbacteria bacterium]
MTTPTDQEEHKQEPSAVSEQTQSAPDHSDLQEQINRLTIACEENLNGWKRAKADYINYKNAQETHAKELAQVANMGALLRIIPIYEQLRNAIVQLSDDLKGSSWVQGVEQISKQFKDALKTLGVEEYGELQGKRFDPALHQALGHEYVEGVKEDHITQQISAGYAFHGNVLLPARVIVNKKPLQT